MKLIITTFPVYERDKWGMSRTIGYRFAIKTGIRCNGVESRKTFRTQEGARLAGERMATNMKEAVQ